jgi:DNA polymerase III alpha subunit
MNDITSSIEDKAKISDELEQMSKAGLQPSVILWSLQNRPHKLDQYVQLADEETIELTGPLAEDFEYAIALEGIKSAQSKHAAGLVISKDTLESSCPTLYDEGSGEQLIGMEYEDAESLGMTKYDFLSLSSLDRLADINKTE